MSITHRIATGAVAAAFAAGSLVGAGVFTASSAGAAAASSSTQCKIKHGNDYPPGKCYSDFSKSSYQPHQKIKFSSGSDFKPGATVHESVGCKSYSKDIGVGSDTAGSGGRVSGGFKLPKKIKHTTCTLSLTGSGSTVEGGFKVK